MKESIHIHHPRNKYQGFYDFEKLAEVHSDLKKFVFENSYGNLSIDFSNQDAVKHLNKSLLLSFYDLKYWDIPENYLCPPIPSRSDYIHHIADLLSADSKIPTRQNIRCLDIGTGANCIYPILGNQEYGWSFVGSDIEKKSLEVAQNNINRNPKLKNRIEFRHQENSRFIFKNIILENEKFDCTLCNPPFHSSEENAVKATLRKLHNLQLDTDTKLNFGGLQNELWCEGGEFQFVKTMIRESKLFATSCLWFTSLISKKENVRPLKVLLKKIGATETKTIPLNVGNKTSRILAWSFSTKAL